MQAEQTAAAVPPARPAPLGPVPAPDPAPTPRSERSLAPDLARGAVLLGIALANVPIYLAGTGPGYRPVDGSTLDRLLDLLVTVFVNDRSRPMFALLLGFGLATMAMRMTARGLAPRRVRTVLVRRSLWLVVFGVVHAALLFEGDILGLYGGTSLLLLALLHRRPRVLLAWSGVSLAVLAVWTGVFAAFPDAVPVETSATTWWASALERLTLVPVSVVGGTLLLVVLAPALAGVALARAGWLDRPWDHVPALRRTVVVGGLVGVLGGVPWALVVGRVWDPGTLLTGVTAGLHVLTGAALGTAYVCACGLVAVRLRGRGTARRGVVGALAATGERSLTSYLLQSVLFAPLLAVWGLGVGERIGTAQAYAVAVAVWLVTVAVATAMARAGRRGPAEVLLRRLTYGRAAARPAVAPPPVDGPAVDGPAVDWPAVAQR